MKSLSVFCLACIVSGLAVCQPMPLLHGRASSVLATVDGTGITRNLYESYIRSVTGRDSDDLSPRQRALALNNLIRAEAEALQATRENLENQKPIVSLLTLSRLNVLKQAVSHKYLAGRTPSSSELHSEYNALIAKMPKIEYHAEHILVRREVLAERIIHDLSRGEKFKTLAKRYSIAPSRGSGGDLGWFSLRGMIPKFSAAVAKLKVGHYTREPVHTQIGWHVVKLLGTRRLKPPPFGEVRNRLKQIVEREEFRKYTETILSKDTIVTYFNPETDGKTVGHTGLLAIPGIRFSLSTSRVELKSAQKGSRADTIPHHDPVD